VSNPLLAFFGRIPLFSGLTPDELNELIRAIQPTKLLAGNLLFKEGDPGDAAYVVESGKLEVFLDRPEGHIKLAELGTNAVLGEITLIDGRKRTAHVRAIDDTSLFRLDKEEFSFLRRNLRPAAYKIISAISVTVCNRLRETNELITHTLAEEIQQPVAREDLAGEADTAIEKQGILQRLAFWRNS
jgi:CRP-like cAMP-binding protein